MERPPRRRSLLVGLFVAVIWAACVFAVAGVLAAVLDRDPIQTPTPAWVGLVGLLFAGVAVWLAVGFTVPARSVWMGACAAAVTVYLVLVGSALMVSFELFVEQAVSPFVITAAIIAAVVVVAAWFAVPRWGAKA